MAVKGTLQGTVDVTRDDDGSESVRTGVKAQVRGTIAEFAEAKIEGSLDSTAYTRPATPPPGAAPRAKGP